MSNHVDEKIYAYKDFCSDCGEVVDVRDPHCQDDITGEFYCWKCGFKRGLVDEKTFIKALPVTLYQRAAIRDNVLHLCRANEKFPWEKTDDRQRNTPQYRTWRTMVFERDGYKCLICGQVGGELNAHHIKPYSKYPEMRYELDNGVTLCKSCHKRIHKEHDDEWIHT